MGSKPCTIFSVRSTASTGQGPMAAISSSEATSMPSSFRLPMIAEPISRSLVIVGQQRELPQHVIGQRRRRRERVLDRRKLFDFLRRVRPVAVVEIVAEEIFVVAVVPGVALFLGLGFGLLDLRGGFGRLQVLGRHLFEHRVLDDFLVQQVGQLERRHRQQLDGLLQRRRQNELLNELRVKFLLNRHMPVYGSTSSSCPASSDPS